MPRLKISQHRNKYGKENQSIKSLGISSKGRLMTSYNSRERNSSLLRYREKPYGIVGLKIDGLAVGSVSSNKLVM